MITADFSQAAGLTQYNVKFSYPHTIKSWKSQSITVMVWAPAGCTDVDGIVAVATARYTDPTWKGRKVSTGYTVLVTFAK